MDFSRLRPRLSTVIILAMLVMVILAGLLPLAQPYQAAAQINNNQPGQPFASVVDCIRSGPNRSAGLTSADSPRFATTCFGSAWNITKYGAGNTDPSNGDALASDPAVVSFGDGQPNVAGSEPGHISEAQLSQMGSVYGLAYSTGTNPNAPAGAPQHQRLFVSAFTKRLTRFGDAGPGGIYVIDRSTGSVAGYVLVFDTVPGPNGAYADPGDGSRGTFPNGTTAANYNVNMGGVHGLYEDAATPPWATITGIGDLDLDPQERYLYAVNLNTKRVHRFDTWSSDPLGTYSILPPLPSLGNPSTCNVSGRSGPQDLRPFGLGITADSLYLGFVCSAQSSQDRRDLAAGVARYDLAAGAWSNTLATAFSLANYDAQRGVFTGTTLPFAWQPWSDRITTTLPRPEPVLSDITFDEAGNMILGLRDRVGDMGASKNLPNETGRAFGDLLLATPSGAYTWNAPTTGAETYHDDVAPDSGSHNEQTMGAVTYLPGRHDGSYGGEIISTMMTPYRINAAGAAWYNASGGTFTSREEIYYDSGARSNNFGKAAGLGDVELLCAWRAIGDRVWRDTNSNGVQDADEPDMNGVPLILRNSSGTVLARVTTGAVSGMPGNWRFYVDPFQSYTVEIDPAAFQPGGALYGLRITTANVGDDNADSDADSSGRVGILPAGRGDLNISYDFGLSVGANVRISKSGPATAQAGQTIAYTLVATNDGPSSADTFTVQDTLPAGVTFVSASPAPASISGQTLTWSYGTVAPGFQTTITVYARVDITNGTLVNQSQVTTSTPGDTPGDNTSRVTTTVSSPNVTIQKTGPAAVRPGDTLTYYLTYRNTGTAAAAGVAVQDTLPAGVSFVSASPAPSSVSGQVLTWNLGTLVSGAQDSITVNATAASGLANGTSLVNQTQISTTTPGDTPGDNTSSTTTIVQRADVRITKSSPTMFPVMSGYQIAYYLDFSNAGPAIADDVLIQDVVPAQLTDVAWNCVTGCRDAARLSTISVRLSTLAAGATGRIEVTGRPVTTLAREDFTNTATITTSTPETDTTNNQSSVPGAVWTTDVQIIKLAQPQVVAGQTLTATLTYKNNGPAPADGVTVQDTLPTGVSFVSASPAPSSVSGQTLTRNLGQLASGQSGTITLVLQAAATIPHNTTVTNQSQINTTDPDRDPSNNTSSAQTVVISRADLQIDKAGPARMAAGKDIQYTLTYTNAGPSVARSAVITDTLPAGVTYQASSPAASRVSGQTLTWNLGDLAPGATGALTVDVTSHTGQTTATLTIINGAQIDSPTDDPTPANNQDDHPVQIETPDLSIVKTMPSVITSGVPFTATLDYANAGPADAENVVVREVLPAGLTLVSSQPPATSARSWDLGTLAAGATSQITLVLEAPSTAAAGTVITNTAQITTTSDDRDLTNNEAQAPTTIETSADLAILKTGPAGPLRSGSLITYTLTYTNAGPSEAQAVTITDTLPPGFTTTATQPQATTSTSATLTWNLGAVDTGASGMITVTGTLVGADDQARTDRTNTATVASTTPDPVPGNNTSTITTTVVRPDLAVRKTDNQTTVQPGDSVTYTLTVINSGPITATNVLLTETPPVGVTVLDSQWTQQATGAWTLMAGDLAPGATLTRTVTMRLPHPLPQSLLTEVRNVVTVEDDDPGDPTPTDTTSTDTDQPLFGRVGDRVWADLDGDGVQDPNEPGLPQVMLEVLDPRTGAVLATTTTDASGMYEFSGLRWGEYAVQIADSALAAIPLNLYEITTDPQPATTISAQTPVDLRLDIGLKPPVTTAVVLSYFFVEPDPAGGNLVRWGTLAEKDTSHFRVLRGTTPNRATATAIGRAESLGNRGGDYRVRDGSPPQRSVYYWLVEVETSGHETWYGPAPVRTTTSMTNLLYLPLLKR